MFIYRQCLAGIALAALGLVAAAPSVRAQQTLYVTNCGPNTVTKINSGVQTTFARSGLNSPTGLAFDKSGNLYVANQDMSGHTIERFTPAGVVSQFASTGLDGPDGLAFDKSGNLYGTNFGANTIERFTPAGVGTVFVSSGLDFPIGLAFDGVGNLYVVTGGNIIKRFTPGGGGSVFATGLNWLFGLAFDASGNLYVANTGDNIIERFTPGGVGSIFASGLGSPRFLAFGPAARARGVYHCQPRPDAGPGRGRAGRCRPQATPHKCVMTKQKNPALEVPGY